MTLTQPERRAVLRAAATVAAAGAGLASPAQAQHAVRWSSGTEAPRTAAPANATDCHFHIYDDGFPAAANAVLTPPAASVEDYRALQRRIGTTRMVLVQPSTYGTNNDAYLRLVQVLGPERTRMVAVVDTSVTDAGLRRLNEAGVRGIRFNLIQAGATTIEMLEPLSKRVAPMGWHVQLHMTGDQIADADALIQRLPVPVVFDHRGRIPQPAGLEHPGFAVVRRMLESGKGWAKLSGLYMDTRVGPPSYADSVAVARALYAANPARCVWGSDWPHPTEAANDKPDDALLFDLLAACVPDEAARRRVLVDNPAELYGFPKA
ncbi:MAG TPA: amidohydrolase family protein [Crenalkalicoccus sp.]|nr:amidohydrolase family protein [Crenalkalicoccus sp.]